MLCHIPDHILDNIYLQSILLLKLKKWKSIHNELLLKYDLSHYKHYSYYIEYMSHSCNI